MEVTIVGSDAYWIHLYSFRSRLCCHLESSTEHSKWVWLVEGQNAETKKVRLGLGIDYHERCPQSKHLDHAITQSKSEQRVYALRVGFTYMI